MAKPTAKELDKRLAGAFSTKGQWEDQLREVYQYAMPQRNLYDEPHAGQRKGAYAYDSTAIRATPKAASKLVAGLFPAGQRWCELEAGAGVPEDNKDEVNEILDKVTDVTFDVIHTASNFQTAIGEWALDLLSGLGLMTVQPGDDDHELVEYAAHPRIAVAIDEGANGKVGGVFRKPVVLCRNVEQQYPGISLDDHVRKMIQDQPEKPVPGLKEATVWLPGEREWLYCVWRKGTGSDGSMMYERRYQSTPWVTTRWLRAANEVEGRGPLLNALPDIKTINKLVELVLKNASLSVAGVYTGVDDGVFNPDTARIVPGAILPVARNQGHPSGPSLAPLERPGDFDVSQIEHDRLQASIMDMLYANALPPMEGPIRSPTEFVQRAKELSQDLSVAYGRFMHEAVVPIMQRTIDILVDKGVLTLPPEVQRIKVGGWGVRLKMTGPLAMMQNLDDLERIARAFELSASMAGPDMTALQFKMEELPRMVHELLGAPASMLRDRKEAEQLMQMVVQQATAMQQEGQPGNVMRAAQAAGAQ